MRDTVVVEPRELCVCLIRETVKSSGSKTGPGNWAQSSAGKAAGLVCLLGGRTVYFLSDHPMDNPTDPQRPSTQPLSLVRLLSVEMIGPLKCEGRGEALGRVGVGSCPWC